MAVFAAAVAAPAGAAHELLDKLRAAGNAEEAAAIEADVWDAWLFSGSPTVDILMQRGIEALDSDDPSLARDMFDRVILIRPDYAEGWNRRALLFFNDGKYDEAVADLERAVAAEPRHFGAWIGLAMIFESIEQPPAALRAWRKVLEIHPFSEAALEAEKRLTRSVEGRSY
jgi:Tfp pilus assembly protein PilF